MIQSSANPAGAESHVEKEGGVPPRWLLPALLVGVGLAGGFLVRNACAHPATNWMLIYQPWDVKSFGELVRFLADLRVPIPPYLATLEIWSTWLTGSAAPITCGLYRLCLVGSYVIALLLVSSSAARLLLTAVTSVLFLASTVVVHAGNPQVYDACFPFLVLAFLWVGGRIDPARARLSLAAAGLAGLLLSLLELTRPYALYLLPFLLLYVIPRLRGARRTVWLAFFAPLVLLSGTWHANQLLAHGQIVWSNHVGFNLRSAWPMVKEPPLIPQPDARKYLNTPEHGENSRRIRNAVLSWIVSNPERALALTFARLRFVLEVQTRTIQYAPDDRILLYYRLVGMLAGCLVIVTGVRVGARVLRAPNRLLETFSKPDHLVAVVSASCLVIVSVGEHGEQARFFVSVLPLLALWPLPRR